MNNNEWEKRRGCKEVHAFRGGERRQQAPPSSLPPVRPHARRALCTHPSGRARRSSLAMAAIGKAIAPKMERMASLGRSPDWLVWLALY